MRKPVVNLQLSSRITLRVSGRMKPRNRQPDQSAYPECPSRPRGPQFTRPALPADQTRPASSVRSF